MTSEMYEACRNGDIDLVQTLIETSPSGTDINRLESNGSTSLHIASIQGHVNIIRLLLYKYKVYPHIKDKNGKTPYELASNKEIRQLLHQSNDKKNRFCSDGNTESPIEVIQNKHSSKSNWLDVYPSTSPILTSTYSKMKREELINWNGIFNSLKNLFGIDSHKKKIEDWSRNLESIIDGCFQVDHTHYLNAHQCLETYLKTREIEHLLRLYTLDGLICKSLVKKDKTNYLYQPILFHLESLSQRAYQGRCFRGLTMTKDDFTAYQLAFNNKKSCIRIKTFCSTSIEKEVAEMFIGQSEDQVNVLMIFNFLQSCPTAIALFSLSSGLRCISQFEEEKEVLILPETMFTVKDIQQDSSNQSKFIYVEYDDMSDESTQIILEGYKTTINNFID